MSTNVVISKLRRNRVANAKRAFTTRRVAAREMQTLIAGNVKPVAGNLVLATVSELGKHRKIEKVNGRRALMLPGDEIIVCYGNRYAPDQFEALVSDDLSMCDLVAGGGIAAREINRHARMVAPTKIMPIGLIGDAEGKPLNVGDFRVSYEATTNPIKVILAAGTAMNAGKTFTAASVVRGLTENRFRVAGIKATGTGSGGDLWQMKDMGANVILDFTDAGFASTYKAPDEEIEAGVLGLINHAARRKCDFAVVEVADGLQHVETATLLRSSALQSVVSGVVFAAYDSMGAKAGYHELRELGYSVLAISGQLTRSPLAMREAEANGCPIYTPFEIQDGALVPAIAGATNQSSITVRKYRDRQELETPSDFVVDFESRQRQYVRSRDIEDAHAFDFPQGFEESA